MKRVLLLLSLLFIAMAARLQTVENIRGEQKGDKIHIHYNITGADENQYFRVIVSGRINDGPKKKLESVTEDVGKGVKGGKDEYVAVWDVLEDVNELNSADFFVRIEVLKGDPQKLMVSVKAGLNGANVKQDAGDIVTPYENQIRPAIRAGIFLEYPFADDFSLQSGLLFSSKGLGNDVVSAYNADSGSETFSFNYLQIPLLATYKITHNIRLHAGPFAAIGIGGQHKYDYSDDGMNFNSSNQLTSVFGGSDNEDTENTFNALDYGLQVGAGYKIKAFLIQAGYNLSLSNVDYKAVVAVENVKMQHRVIHLSLSYILNY